MDFSIVYIPRLCTIVHSSFKQPSDKLRLDDVLMACKHEIP